MTWWQLRRLFLGDRRKSDRVVSEAKAALRRLDEALSTMERAGDWLATTDHEHKQAGDER